MFVLLLMIVRLIAKAVMVLEIQFLEYVNVKNLSELIKFVTKLVEIQLRRHKFLQLEAN